MKELETLSCDRSVQESLAPADPWGNLRAFTSARIALGRTGGSQLTGSVLDFRLSHARARDAVQSEFDADLLENTLRGKGVDTFRLETAAKDRRTYLLRPDLGRSLDESSRRALANRLASWGRRDLAIILSDGLAAQAVERNAVQTLLPLVEYLKGAGWSIFPILVAKFGRVKLQDEIGEILGARQTLMFLGERPGLGSPDSLGAYFTHNPTSRCTDADRNCVSNIRPEGFPPAAAADKLARLLHESARIGVSGVALKDSHLPPVPKLGG